MTRMPAFIVFLLATLTLDASWAQSHADFVAAVRNNSTAPSFVKIQITDLNTGATYTACVPASALRGAVHAEQGEPSSREGRRKVFDLIVTNTSHDFGFRTREVLDNFFERPKPEDIQEAGRLLDGTDLPIADFLKSEPAYAFYKINQARRSGRGAALACALIDRGYMPYSHSMNGSILILERR